MSGQQGGRGRGLSPPVPATAQAPRLRSCCCGWLTVIGRYPERRPSCLFAICCPRALLCALCGSSDWTALLFLRPAPLVCREQCGPVFTSCVVRAAHRGALPCLDSPEKAIKTLCKRREAAAEELASGRRGAPHTSRTGKWCSQSHTPCRTGTSAAWRQASAPGPAKPTDLALRFRIQRIFSRNARFRSRFSVSAAFSLRCSEAVMWNCAGGQQQDQGERVGGVWTSSPACV